MGKLSFVLLIGIMTACGSSIHSLSKLHRAQTALPRKSEAERVLFLNSEVMTLHKRLLRSFKFRARLCSSEAQLSKLKDAVVDEFNRQIILICAPKNSNHDHGLHPDHSGDWTTEGLLADFVSDIDDILQNNLVNQQLSMIYLKNRLNDTLAFGNRDIWRKRTRWAASKLLMMAVSKIQKKLREHSELKASQKRLEEIPDIPLL